MNPFSGIIPSRSALLHLRFPFSFLLMPVFLFALSQAPQIIVSDAVLTFIIWHLLVYPASNGYNSYFDKDEDSIALLKKPPPVDITLYRFSLLLDVLAILLAVFINVQLLFAVLVYGVFSKLYSHPATRLKKYPVISFLIVFIFQGACIFWSSYAAVSGIRLASDWSVDFFLAGLICSCLIGATYPLTQVYQHAEDRKRGDQTLSMLLGIRGSFWFAGTLFALATCLLFFYWNLMQQPLNFWLFLVFASPVFLVFLNWFYKVWKNSNEANFQNMMRLTLISGALMLCYFVLLNFI